MLKYKSAADAFIKGKDFTYSNTSVNVKDNETIELLHYDKIIAWKNKGEQSFSITTQGLRIASLIEKLNSLPGVRIEYCGGELFLNGSVWHKNGSSIKRIKLL